MNLVFGERWLLAALLGFGGLSAFGQAPAVSAAPRQAHQTAAVWRPSHIVIVIDENHSYAEINHNPQAPFVNLLMRQGASFANYHGVEHPSLPNYLDLFSGSDQNHTSDSTDVTFASTNLATTLQRAHRTFRGYAENLPASDFKTSSAFPYAAKHAPWVLFNNVPQVDNQPFSKFPTDFRQLPTISFVIPNLLDDMHDGSVARGDAWLKQHLGRYARWAKTHNSLLVLTWDEDDYSASNTVPLVMVGAMVRPGLYQMPLNHYNLLRTVEDMYGLKPLGKSAGVQSIAGVWRKP